jgi:predicted nucleotidyltransferase
MTLLDATTKSVADRLPAGLLGRIVAHLNPIKVIVFGSQARGNTHEDSDWDLLVVVDDDISAERINWRGIGEARRGVRGAIDLIPCRESTFHDRKDIVGSLPWIALNEGIAVYERSKTA